MKTIQHFYRKTTPVTAYFHHMPFTSLGAFDLHAFDLKIVYERKSDGWQRITFSHPAIPARPKRMPDGSPSHILWAAGSRSFHFNPRQWKRNFRRFLVMLNPLPAYTSFSGTDCDHSRAHYLNRYPTHYHAIKAMEAACESWEEGPCGWSFLTREEYDRAVDERDNWRY